MARVLEAASPAGLASLVSADPASTPPVDAFVSRQEVVAQKEARVRELERLLATRTQEAGVRTRERDAAVAARRAEVKAHVGEAEAALAQKESETEAYIVTEQTRLDEREGRVQADSTRLFSALDGDVARVLAEMPRPLEERHATEQAELDAFEARLQAREAGISAQEAARSTAIEQQVAVRVDDLMKPLQGQYAPLFHEQDEREQVLTAAEQRLQADTVALVARVAAEAAKIFEPERAALDADYARQEANLRDAWSEARARDEVDAVKALDALGPWHEGRIGELVASYEGLSASHREKGDALSADIKKLEDRIRQYDEPLKAARAEEKKAQETLQKAEARRKAELSSVQAELDRAVARRDGLRNELEGARQTVNGLRQAHDQAVRDKSGLDSQLSSMQSDAGRLRTDIGNLQWAVSQKAASSWNTTEQ